MYLMITDAAMKILAMFGQNSGYFRLCRRWPRMAKAAPVAERQAVWSIAASDRNGNIISKVLRCQDVVCGELLAKYF